MADAAMRRGRYSYVLKFAAAAALGVAADWLFLFQWFGANLGYFALALAAAVALLRPSVRRDRGGVAGLLASFCFALVLVEDPSLLAVSLYWCMLAFTVLSPRTASFDHALRWVQRLLIHTALIPAGPIVDFARWLKVKRRARPWGISRFIPMLALPLIGSVIFIALFASANPLISDAIGRVDIGLLTGIFSLPRLVVWGFAFVMCWAMLRPLATRALARPGAQSDAMIIPGVTVASVTLSLILFNTLFALQNGLDIAFLWSGAPLPDGMTLAGYAHRGAYPLIATALLAAVFVLVTMRPGSSTAASGAIRRLVTLWTAQNVFLVASSILRTLDYIEAYSLTRLRIAALIWMALVALGLILICVRLWRSKSDAWLINANFGAALIVLSACSVVDLGRMAAAWNVRHAAEAGGTGTALDLCYLNNLGPSALLPILELEARTQNGELKSRLEWSRNAMMDRMDRYLADWHGWTWRDARRLAEAERIIAEKALPRYRAGPRLCDGRIAPPPPPPPSVSVEAPIIAPTPLTAEPAR